MWQAFFIYIFNPRFHRFSRIRPVSESLSLNNSHQTIVLKEFESSIRPLNCPFTKKPPLLRVSAILDVPVKLSYNLTRQNLTQMGKIFTVPRMPDPESQSRILSKKSRTISLQNLNCQGRREIIGLNGRPRIPDTFNGHI